MDAIISQSKKFARWEIPAFDPKPDRPGILKLIEESNDDYTKLAIESALSTETLDALYRRNMVGAPEPVKRRVRLAERH